MDDQNDKEVEGERETKDTHNGTMHGHQKQHSTQHRTTDPTPITPIKNNSNKKTLNE